LQFETAVVTNAISHACMTRGEMTEKLDLGWALRSYLSDAIRDPISTSAAKTRSLGWLAFEVFEHKIGASTSYW
jgi:hypothetical protein